MTGAEHYRQAEVLLDEILSTEAADATEVEIEIAIRTAQVHATLAMAAAIAEMDVYAAGWSGAATGRSEKRAKAWAEAMGS